MADFNEAMDTVDTELKKATDAMENVVESAKTAAQEVVGNKADKSTEYNMTLAAASWTGDTAPYSITLSVAKATTTNNIDIIPQASTADAIESWQALGYMLGTQEEGSITIQAWGDKPTADIPVKVIIRGDA